MHKYGVYRTAAAAIAFTEALSDSPIKRMCSLLHTFILKPVRDGEPIRLPIKTRANQGLLTSLEDSVARMGLDEELEVQLVDDDDEMDMEDTETME